MDTLNEIKQRTVRIETRLMALAQALGFNLRVDEEMEVDTTEHTVRVQTLDIPYTSVLNACHKAGLYRTKVRVLFGDRTIGVVYV